MAFNLNQFASGWKLAGILALAVGAGASGMAASVKSSIAEHATATKAQGDSLLAVMRDIRQLELEQLCIAVGVTPKLVCLQK